MITTHSISVFSEWPSPTESIALYLRRQDHAEAPSESVAIAHNDDGLSNPVVLKIPRDSPDEVDCNFLSTNVAGIASVYRNYANQALLRPTIMYWYPLIAHAIEALLSEDIVMSADVAFVVPLEETKTRLATATISACYVTTIPDRFRFRKYESDQETKQSLSNALSAHVLSSLAIHPNAAIPIIVVGSGPDIASLVSSVVHQYYLWGIDLPVVGINISTTDRLARLVVGWSEVVDQKDSPIEVHIAFSTKDQADSDVGVFDLSNIDSTLHLVNFISDLKSHIIGIREYVHMDAPPVRSLNWRSDESRFWLSKYTEDRHSSSIMIEAWASKMDEAYSEFRGEAVGVKDFEDTNYSSASVQRVRPGSCYTLLLTQFRRSLQRLIERNSKREVKIIPPDFVTLDSLHGQTSMVSMMSEREAILLPLYKFSPENVPRPAYMQEIDLRVAAYSEVTKHAWPYQWKTSTDLPVLTKRAQKLGKNLIEQHNADQNGKRLRQRVQKSISRGQRHKLKNKSNSKSTDHAIDGAFNDLNDDSPSIKNSIDSTNTFTGNSTGESVEGQFNGPNNDPTTRNGPTSDTDQPSDASDEPTEICDLRHEPGIYERLVDGLSDLLITVEILQHLFRTAFIAIPESCRIQVDHLWNFLFHRFFDDGTSSPHQYISPHMTINYSKNLCFEQVMNGDLEGASLRSLELHEHSAYKLRRKEMSDDCPSIISEGLQIKEQDYVSQAISMSYCDCDTAEWAFRQHGVSEPSQGYLNGVLGVSIPIPGPSEGQTSSAVFQDTMRSRALVREASEGRWDHLWFPTALLWHGESDEPNDATMNEMKLLLVSAIAFYHTLGIGNQPVWGLVTHGTEVQVMYAWRSEVNNQYTYIFDNNLAWFDICEPLSCYRFCVFLLRLSEKNKELRKKIEEGDYVERFFAQAEDSPLDNWTVQSVRDKFREFHEPLGL
ncbi:hypothetical protein H0H92_011333 [Tricholoma furcatifolium]|nr:hypothetical protein H0H92_011333 [Tricholoma furcatifolium]